MKERIDKVVEILARKGYRSVSELSSDLDVSEMTVRRYLDRLEQRQLIKRTHGGAYSGLEMIEVDYRVRETVRRAEKEAIGRLAWSLIQPGESIFIDAGSTTAYLALAMDDTRRITVVTNSTTVLQTLESKSNIETILLGGKVHALSHSLVGPIAEETVRQFRFTRAFLGAVGINLQEGFTQSNIDEVPVKKQVAANARQVIVLADSSKVNRDVLVLFLRLDQVHTVITDSGIMPEDRAAHQFSHGNKTQISPPLSAVSTWMPFSSSAARSSGMMPLSVMTVWTWSRRRNSTRTSRFTLELSARTMTCRAFAATCFFTGTSSMFDWVNPS